MCFAAPWLRHDVSVALQSFLLVSVRSFYKHDFGHELVGTSWYITTFSLLVSPLNFPMLQARKHRFAMEDREAEAVRWQVGEMAGDNKLTIAETC